MKTTRAVAVAGTLALAATALTAGPASAASASGRHDGNHHDSSVFVQTDNTGGNTVVAYDRSTDGTLHQDGVYATGGLGGVLGGSVVDHLASQGSLAFDRTHDLLYAVNAGSNTVTVFGVEGDHLRRLQVVRSGGTFPVSVAVHGNAVYVLNARDGGSVQGFLRIGHTLIAIPAWHRDLGLDPSLTPEFTHTPGQVAFTRDGSALLVTTKAASSSVDAFRLSGSGELATKPVVTSLPGAVPFATTFDRSGHLLLAEAGTNSLATFTVRGDGSLVPLTTAATGQAATCWIVRVGSNVYLSNAGSANLSGYHVSPDATAATALGTTATDAGTIDAAASSNAKYLYVETGAAGIVDEFAVGAHGALTAIGSITVPDAAGAEGIAAT
jgi:6-phosphogluconolactonase (cycloisomerase 2 family)